MKSKDAVAFLKRESTGRRLVWTVVWWGTHFGFFAYGWWSQYTNAKLAALNGLKYSVWTSRGAGLVLAFDGGLILLPVLRNVITAIRPALQRILPVDENLWFHRQVAYQLLLWTIIHTTAHYVNFINVERTQVRKERAVQIHYAQAGGITGHTMLLIMFLMYTTAHSSIRKQCFEAFWYTHHLAFFFMLALYTHATGCFVRDSVDPDYIPTFPFYSTEHCLGYLSWRFIIWPGIIYFGERVYRQVRAARATEIQRVLYHPGNVMEIRFKKPSMKYKAGQWLFLNVPDVSRWQWHPFTISSAPEDPFISVHIRQVGDFTTALGERLGATPDLHRLDSGKKGGRGEKNGFVEVDSGLGGERAVEVGPGMDRGMPKLRIDGPFGAPAEDVFASEVAVLVAAGIGVTPFASILKHIWYAQQAGKMGRLRRVEFVWTCRETGSFGWIKDLLEELEEAQRGSDFLRISIYLTQRMGSDEVHNIAINDVGQEYDPLTKLRSRTLYGRPDFHSFFANLATSIDNGSYLPGREARLKNRVGVYYCGPNPLARTVRTECLKIQSSTLDVRFAKEHF
ncbi:ferric reductase NAD binding domain-containing protein [Dioszegia hungarica]|uniref:Ferric reductase NAD binding domain-containing protein n=1 Tax=Dioszegia hungarica TaxID=4972 RepID=A0AA38HFE7_9TREE|nr:ferric reductase NAD binding domain-containing protein [Dioszegia hungarica]KAI9639408.1 ferric reductase NAD binding domain-containing protein [Dioszegia hungarica]